MRSPILKKILVLTALFCTLLPFQNCIFLKSVGSTSAGKSTGSSQSTIPTLGGAESNGNGYDGKVFVNRGVCGNELFGVQSAVQMSSDGTKAARIVENCAPVNYIPVSKSQLTIANNSTFVLDGNIHNYEFETPPRLVGKVLVKRGDDREVDQLYYGDGKNIHRLKLENNFLKIDRTYLDETGAPFDYSSNGYSLEAIGIFRSPFISFNLKIVMRQGNRLAYHEFINADAISNQLNQIRMDFNSNLTSDMKIVGVGKFLTEDPLDTSGAQHTPELVFSSEQILLRGNSGFKVIAPNFWDYSKILSLNYLYTQTQSTAVVQETDAGFAFLGMGRFSNDPILQPIRKVEDALQLPVGDARVLNVPSANGGVTIETKGQPVLVMRKNQRVVAIANVEGDSLSEIIFEENNTLYMLRHLPGNKLGSVTLGNLVNPL